jgi:hypothetical protein
MSYQALPADQQTRIACLQAAMQSTGNPNHVTLAREFYVFVTEGQQAQKYVAPAPNEADAPAPKQQALQQKTNRRG